MLKDTGDGPISGFVLNEVLDCFGRKKLLHRFWGPHIFH